MNVGSLFSGIGGLDLAVEQHFGAELAWLCEYDQPARGVLERRFPGVPCYPDVRELGADTPTVDILVGGYPCQPFSVAGLRKGEDDPRHLWPHFARLIRLLRPRFVVAENVAGHLRLGFDAVLADLAGLGMDVRWGVVRASDAGAPHQRARLFVVAADAAGTRDGTNSRTASRDEVRDGSEYGDLARGDGEAAADADRESVRAGQRRASCTQGTGEGEGTERQRVWSNDSECVGAAADADGERSHGRRGSDPSAAAGVGPDGRSVAAGHRASDAHSDLARLERPQPEERHDVPTGGGGSAAADAECERRPEGRTESEGRKGRAVPVGDTTPAADADSGRREGVWVKKPQGVKSPCGGVADGRDAVRQLNDATSSPDADGERREPRRGRRTTGGDHARADTPQRDGSRQLGSAEQGQSEGRTAASNPPFQRNEIKPQEPRREPAVERPFARASSRTSSGATSTGVPRLDGSERVAWGAYEPVIRRWEYLTGAAAPRPTDDRGRLMPEFVEWMMDYPVGWTEGASRTQRLKMLGNAVVPAQALLALRLLEADLPSTSRSSEEALP